MSKVGIARGLIGGYITLKYLQEMEENYRKGDWLEAAKDTGWFAVAMTPIVAPKFFWGSIAYPVTVGVTAGVVTTAVVLEVTGLGEWEDAVILALDPPTPVEWIKVVGPAIQSEITEPALKYVEGLWETMKEDVTTWRQDIQSSSASWYQSTKEEMLYGEPMTVGEAWNEFWSVRRFTL